ncbi:hypothetical protein LZ31DRAFT_19630 [Colletotrichum somersetense]|nr:hypothetical protein LZ31DRAFT_19630 [Colletotrichum somersetense]
MYVYPSSPPTPVQFARRKSIGTRWAVLAPHTPADYTPTYPTSSPAAAGQDQPTERASSRLISISSPPNEIACNKQDCGLRRGPERVCSPSPSSPEVRWNADDASPLLHSLCIAMTERGVRCIVFVPPPFARIVEIWLPVPLPRAVISNSVRGIRFKRGGLLSPPPSCTFVLDA